MDGSTDPTGGSRRKKCLYIRLRRDLGRGSSAILAGTNRGARCDTGRRSGATLSPARPLVPRIDPRTIYGGDRFDRRSRGPRALTLRRLVSPRLAMQRRAVFLWPWERDGGINPLGRLLTLGTTPSLINAGRSFPCKRANWIYRVWSETRTGNLYRIQRADSKSEQQANLNLLSSRVISSFEKNNILNC